MRFKGTNGEWKVEIDGNPFESTIFCNELRICEVKSYGTPFNDPSLEERIANAKLIASAPDLLKALEQIQFAVKNGNVKGLFHDEINDMDNAIEKALKTDDNGVD
jgi:hypothetical protein